jgi:hypothetical protein
MTLTACDQETKSRRLQYEILQTTNFASMTSGQFSADPLDRQHFSRKRLAGMAYALEKDN